MTEILAPEPMPAPDFELDHRLSDAIAEAGAGDFGDPLLPQNVNAYLTAIRDEADISPIGGLGLQSLVHQLLVNRLRYHADLAKHPSIEAEQVADPIVITGLFRTGTTKLQRMLSADPANQPLTFWRIFNPAPLPNSPLDGPDPRIALAEGYVEALAAGSPAFMAAHPWIVDEPDEDSLLLWLTFDHLAGASVGFVPSFVERVQRRPQRPNYDYLAGVLRYLQWQDGGGRGRPWILKSPTHIGNLEPLLGAFPRATVVHCHRDPVVVVASFVRLFEIFWGLFGNAVDPMLVGPTMLDLWATEMERNLEQRDRLGEDARIVDIRYDDIVARPFDVIDTIYGRHGTVVTDHGHEAMAGWERDNPQHKFGKHDYSLAACGLTEEQVRDRFSAYTARFGSYFARANSEPTP